MTTEQKLTLLEGLCDRAYELGKDILDPNVKDSKKKVMTMIGVAGAFMGGYDAYKKRVRAAIEDSLKELKDKRDRENGTN